MKSLPTILHDDDTTRDVRQCAYNNSRTAERIFMKFGMDVISLDATSNFYLLFNFSQSVNPMRQMLELIWWNNDPL
jgi:hypothetical protein